MTFHYANLIPLPLLLLWLQYPGQPAEHILSRVLRFSMLILDWSYKGWKGSIHLSLAKTKPKAVRKTAGSDLSQIA